MFSQCRVKPLKQLSLPSALTVTLLKESINEEITALEMKNGIPWFKSRELKISQTNFEMKPSNRIKATTGDEKLLPLQQHVRVLD